jgi:hypothetical protein
LEQQGKLWKTELSRDLLIICTTVLVVHGLLVFDNVPRWDGWLIYEMIESGSWHELRREFSQTGVPMTAYMHYAIGQLPAFVTAYKVVTLLALMTIAVSLYALLRDFAAFGRVDRLILTILFVAFPAYLVTVELIMAPVTVYGALFALGAVSYRASAMAETRAARVLWRVLALGLFYGAFLVQSFLVFYAAFFIYAFARWHRMSRPTLGSTLSFARAHIDFMLLPFAFYAVKLLWFQPYGDYAGYNELRPSLTNLIKGSLRALYGGFLLPTASSLLAVANATPLVLSLSLLAFLMWRTAESMRPAQDWSLCLLGVVLLLIAVAPYAVVGKIPSPKDWVSRFAVHVPLGAAFFTYYGIRGYVRTVGLPRGVAIAAALLLASCFGAQFIRSYLGYGVDALKQEALILRFRETPAVAQASTVVVEDSATHLNAHARLFRYYEYSALLHEAYGESRRLGVGSYEFIDGRFVDPPKLSSPFRLFLSKHESDGRTVRVRIKSSFPTEDLTEAYIRSLFWRLRGGRQAQRNELLRSLIALEVLGDESL